MVPNLFHESSLFQDVANDRFYYTHTFSPLPNEQLIPFKIRSNPGLYLVEYSLKTISPFSGQCSPGRLFSITFGAYNDAISNMSHFKLKFTLKKFIQWFYKEKTVQISKWAHLFLGRKCVLWKVSKKVLSELAENTNSLKTFSY